MTRKLSICLAILGIVGFCAIRGLGAGDKAKDDKPAVAAVGADTCLSCHADYDKTLGDSPHKAVFKKDWNKKGLLPGCEACHGPGGKHIDNPGKDIVNFKDSGDFARKCLTCHAANPKLARWERGTHAKSGVACNNCHAVHAGKADRKKVAAADRCIGCHAETAAQFRQPSRHPVPEGKMKCADCHNPHGNNDDAGAFGSLGQKCSACHAEKAGPYLFQHAPVAEDCLNCHTPHGSSADKLTTTRVPNLCIQCHPDALTAHPPIPNSATIRNCTGCHTRIHGSNNIQNLTF